jgi:predicted dehydrogenase
MGWLHSKSYHQVNYHYPELEVRPRLLVAVDTAPDRVRFAIDELGYLEGTNDWRSVIAHPEVEAVNITAPNYVHREIAILAAEQGKHFWIEKPVGRNVDETEDIDRAARAAGVITAVGFNYRHAPAVQHARELVRSGGIGRVVHMR